MVKALTDSSSSTVNLKSQSGRSLFFATFWPTALHVVLHGLVFVEAVGRDDLLVVAARLLDLALGGAQHDVLAAGGGIGGAAGDGEGGGEGEQASLRIMIVTPAGAGGPEG